MNTHQFYLTEMGFVSLILIFLSLLITVYLIQVRSKSRSSWLLIGFFCSVILNGFTMLIANAWVLWGAMFMPAQDAWILLGGVALAQYAYHYPQLDQKHEARFVLVVTSSVALFAATYSLYYALQYIFEYSADLDVNQAYYLLLPSMTLVIVAVFLRRAVRYASLLKEEKPTFAQLSRLAKAISRPPNREVRTLRDFALALSLGLLPGVAYILKPIPIIPAWLPSYMLSIGSVLAVSALALVYINSSREQTSFIGKIMGISLVTFLLIFGAFGSSLIERYKSTLPGGEIGLSQIHDLVVYLTSWVVLSCLIILFFFPVFYRINLVFPLKHLLDGVKLADRGDLEIQIPVQYEDEIRLPYTHFQ